MILRVQAGHHSGAKKFKNYNKKKALELSLFPYLYLNLGADDRHSNDVICNVCVPFDSS